MPRSDSQKEKKMKPETIKQAIEEIDRMIEDGRRVGVAVAEFSSPPNHTGDESFRDMGIYRRGIEAGIAIAKETISGTTTSLPHWAE